LLNHFNYLNHKDLLRDRISSMYLKIVNQDRQYDEC